MQYSWARNACQPLFGRWVDSCRIRLAPLFWPATCILCGQEGSGALDLCAACEADLVLNRHACTACAEPLPEATGPAPVCGACLRHPPPFQMSYAPYRYAYPLDHLIRGLKFRRELVCGRVLGELFARRLSSTREGPMPECIIPVPLAPQRYRQRGYNQATELALPIRRLTRVPVRADIVIRQRETLEQAALNQRERRRNVRRAFAVIAPLPPRHVAILDDVVTTGSTVSELSKALRRAGATRIEVWAIARAGRDGSY